MAADMLVHRATHVPVGVDQQQHLEFTRDLVQLVNRALPSELQFFAPVGMFPSSSTERIMSLSEPTKKMSKSDPDSLSCLLITDEEATMRKKVMAALTDCDNSVRFHLESKPGISNLLRLYSVFEKCTIREAEERFASASYRQFKEAVCACLAGNLAPIRERYLTFKNCPPADLISTLEKNEGDLSVRAENFARQISQY